MKFLTLVALMVTTVFATSCKKDSSEEKPPGAGMQGVWSTTALAGGTVKTFTFEAMPSDRYVYKETSTGSIINLPGKYTYILATDKLTIQSDRDGSLVETYNVQWVDIKTRKSFNLVATGTTDKGKEATYTLSN